MTTVTQWFDYSKKPAHNGVYQRAYGFSKITINIDYAYWKDDQWFFRGCSVEQAKDYMHAGMESFGGAWQWRGLAEKPA